MKKLLALVISAIMVLSFAACGGTPDVDEDLGDDLVSADTDLPADSGDSTEVEGQEPEGDTPVDGGEDLPVDGGETPDPVDPDTPTESPEDPVVEPDDNDVVIEGPVFANDWASNDIEKMLPNPPFGPWEKVESPEDLHIIATPLDAIDYGVGSIDRMALANYFAWLKGMDFTVKEVGYSSKDVLGSELPDHWLIFDHQGRVAQLSIYCDMEGKEGFTGYSIITFELDTFDIEDSGSSEPYDPQPDSDIIMDMDEVLSFLPTLPFSGWVGGHLSSNVYEYSVTGLNTSAATNPPDSGEPDGKDKDTFIGYLSTLISRGFDVVEVSNGYKWTAADRYGNFVTFMIGDGGLFLTVERAADSPAIEPEKPNEEPSGPDASVVTLPELPYGEWTRRDVAANQYDLMGTNVDEWEMCEMFVSDLYAAGYNVYEIFYDSARGYEYQAEKGIGSYTIVIYIQGDIPNQNAVIHVSVE